jgi:hypothetical protein
MQTLGHLVLAAALPWVLVSHITTQQCQDNVCTPLPETPASVQELGRFATQANCERSREALAPVWTRLEREGEQELPPKPDRLELQTTFRCVPADDQAPQEEGR